MTKEEFENLSIEKIFVLDNLVKIVINCKIMVYLLNVQISLEKMKQMFILKRYKMNRIKIPKIIVEVPGIEIEVPQLDEGVVKELEDDSLLKEILEEIEEE